MTTALLFWIVVAAAALLLAQHPFVTYPLSLVLMRRFGRGVPRAPVFTRSPPPMRFALCTCAYNEASVIEAKLLNLLMLRERHPGIEILVYVDSSSDETAAICRRYADRIEVHEAPRRTGKTHGMNLLVSRTRADVVVFSDANVMLDAAVLERLEHHFIDRMVGCVCGHLEYTNAAASVTAHTGSLYWRHEEWIKGLESDTGSVMGADGSLFAIRRTLHHPPPDHIIDDMYVSFMVLCSGHRIVQAGDVRAFEQSVPSMAEEFQRKVRIGCQAFNVNRLLWPHLMRLRPLSLYKYLSHKLLRWFTIYLLVVAYAAGVVATLVGGAYALTGLLLAALGALWLFGYRWPTRPVAQLFDALSAMAGAGFGVWRSVLGEVYQTWQPAGSIRAR